MWTVGGRQRPEQHPGATECETDQLQDREHVSPNAEPFGPDEISSFMNGHVRVSDLKILVFPKRDRLSDSKRHRRSGNYTRLGLSESSTFGQTSTRLCLSLSAEIWARRNRS